MSKSIHLEERSTVSANSSDSNTISNIEKQDIAEIEEYKEEFLGDIKSEYNYKNDPHNPMNLPKGKKLIITLLISANAFIGYFSAAVYMPGTSEIMKYFKTNLTTINATIALFLLTNAIAPLFLAPLSERIGRRWIYIVGMALYSVCTLICGISKSLGLFIAFRLFQGVFACTGQAIGGGSVSDIFEPHERGKAMSIYIFGTILGPAVAPMIGGYVTQYLGWRWIFYIKAIIGGVLTLLNFIFMSETLYTPNPPPPPTNLKERIQRLKFNPFTSLNLLTRPEIALTALPTSLAFGWFYFLVTILPQTYSSIYHFSTGSIGLCYLAGGIGNISGAVLSGVISDKLYASAVKKNQGTIVKEFRLRPMYFGIPFFTLGPIMYGWFLHYRVHWIGPLFGYGLANFGIMFTIAVSSTYLIDTQPSKAASMVASTNLTRNLFGMLFSLVAVYIRQSLGDGWAYTLFALTCLVCYIICIPIVQKFGPRWRERK